MSREIKNVHIFGVDGLVYEEDYENLMNQTTKDMMMYPLK